MRLATDNQFTLTRSCWTPYEWVVGEDVNRFNDFLDPLARIFHLKIHRVVKYALEILTNLWCKFN
ncbi:hypothetical protein GALL_204080 [mine drainage metagenome]|uniref:Uncharacterized protein n=1 Tax=mine drainage metagenome TaxID=410659 RepID=A0A1J5RZM8_9ZZZZ